MRMRINLANLLCISVDQRSLVRLWSISG